MLPRRLVALMQLAHSAERAAAFAYQGHAAAVRDPDEKREIARIEQEEWDHRAEVLRLMEQYDVPVSRYLEAKYWIIGRLISASCHVIGWFMPMYFAGRLESGNVVEYVVMRDLFHQVGITEHDECLLEMADVEKEHERFFAEAIREHPWTPLFERLFRWGPDRSFNDYGSPPTGEVPADAAPHAQRSPESEPAPSP